MALRVDTQSTTQAAKKLLSIRVSNFMAVLLRSEVMRDLGQHGAQGGHAEHDAGGKEAVEHQGFEFHGGSPWDE
jgi:hypothetical protein